MVATGCAHRAKVFRGAKRLLEKGQINFQIAHNQVGRNGVKARAGWFADHQYYSFVIGPLLLV